jgi:hypothetical protein
MQVCRMFLDSKMDLFDRVPPFLKALVAVPRTFLMIATRPLLPADVIIILTTNGIID